MAEIEGQDPQLNVKRMSCEEFKFVIKDKGWLMKNVAERWKLGTVRMSQICSDEERPLYYDDAVRALPRKKM
ncbi:MAG: hypothetical protein KAY83_05130 [Agitococcus sp.]|jgi:hypothetical protein|nr:hypothetical protein [Agitococcus sp.]